jgi:radical SAM-linked protein
MIEKLRIRFRKAGDLRFLSHHDLMRLFERMLRRAELPFRSTEGFHPKPRMQFASALALGIVGHEEVIEIEFDAGLTLEVVEQRLSAQRLEGLELLSIKAIPRKINGQVTRATYFLPLATSAHPELDQRVAALINTAECWIDRLRPHPKRLNIRPYILELKLPPDGLVMTLQVTPTGTARAEEVLQALGLAELLMNGTVLERTRLELIDEQEAVSCQSSVVSCQSSVAEPLLGPLTTDDGQRTTDN